MVKHGKTLEDIVRDGAFAFGAVEMTSLVAFWCGSLKTEEAACDEDFPQSSSTGPSCGFDERFLVFFHLMQSTHN